MYMVRVWGSDRQGKWKTNVRGSRQHLSGHTSRRDIQLLGTDHTCGTRSLIDLFQPTMKTKNSNFQNIDCFDGFMIGVFTFHVCRIKIHHKTVYVIQWISYESFCELWVIQSCCSNLGGWCLWVYLTRDSSGINLYFSSVPTAEKMVTSLSCMTKIGCKQEVLNEVKLCCYTDFCNSAGNLPSSTIFMILTVSLSLLLTCIM